MPATPSAPASSAVVPGRVADGARAIRLKRGAQPTHSSLTGFQRWCWKTFRNQVLARPPDPTLEENLLKAHIRLRADEYMTTVYGTTIAVAAGMVVAGIVVAFFLIDLVGLPVYLGIAAAVALPAVGAVGTFFAMPGQPGSTAKARAWIWMTTLLRADRRMRGVLMGGFSRRLTIDFTLSACMVE